MTKLDENLFEIKYVPNDVGTYKIIIKFNEEEIPSSPYYARVINPKKVKILDDFLNPFEPLNLGLNEEKCLCFDTSESGNGDIKVDIISPDNQIIPHRKFYPSTDLHKISFYPPYEGEYKIKVFLNKKELHFSPISAITRNFLDLINIKVYGDGLISSDLNKISNFFIDFSKVDLKETPELLVSAISENSKELKINVEKLEENIFKCSYKAEFIGQYLLRIKFNQLNVKFSPYIIRVGLTTDPTKIIINQDDFKNGILGEELSTLIDTKQAGPGELSVNCIGTRQSAKCEFIDKQDGCFELKVKPVETGKHLLYIRYNDISLLNSPFTFRVSAPPDASKVKVFGPGVTHGVIVDFNSSFVCDTKGAGAGQLTVRIRGPKGAFRVEMKRKDDKDRKIECIYDPLESGEYQINVQWSGKHVPYSPFNVQIFNTKEELDSFLNQYPDEKSKYLTNSNISSKNLEFLGDHL
ncbi:unnamed protein product [Brachionus calyciflorus]|uniref:Uncharacterized protein n=1 Tax=Brachionus calyciflorus TaxID=104777 RepID=A0A813MIZ5_9BILA|nr:unnamed protein product [Brachionus calyciflorus]